MTHADSPDWPARVTATVVAEVRRRRKELGMTAQALADACEEIGHPIPRNVIANLESGRRTTLALVDVLVLARALETPPICLIFPVGHTARAEPLPLQEQDPWHALTWFTGEDHNLWLFDEDLQDFREHAHALRALQQARTHAWNLRQPAASPDDTQHRAEALTAADEQVQRAQEHLHRLRHRMREDDLVLPRLPPDLSSIDEEPPPGHDDQEDTP